MENQQHHHITPVKTYVAVGVALLFLTAVTVWIAHFDFGNINMLVAMVVATIKASLVAMIFMGLKYDKKLYLVSLFITLAAVLILFAFTMNDMTSRTAIYDVQMQEIKKQSSIYDKKDAPTAAPSTTEMSSEEKH